MILGRFCWRGKEREADAARTDLMGEVVWLNRIDLGSSTGIGMVAHGGEVHLTQYAPTDDLARRDLRSAYDAFRSSESVRERRARPDSRWATPGGAPPWGGLRASESRGGRPTGSRP